MARQASFKGLLANKATTAGDGSTSLIESASATSLIESASANKQTKEKQVAPKISAISHQSQGAVQQLFPTPLCLLSLESKPQKTEEKHYERFQHRIEKLTTLFSIANQ